MKRLSWRIKTVEHDAVQIQHLDHKIKERWIYKNSVRINAFEFELLVNYSKAIRHSNLPLRLKRLSPK